MATGLFLGTFPRHSTLRGHYVQVEAHDIYSAMEILSLMYPLGWHQCLIAEDYLDALQTKGLTEVPLGTLQVEVS